MPSARRISSRILILVTFSALAAIPGLIHAQSAPLRTLDWNTVLAADPDLHVVDSLPPFFDSPGQGPYVIVAPPETVIVSSPDKFPDVQGDVTAQGWARTSDIEYGDLDGDGREEAVIPLDSGGTAGQIGFLLYGAAAGRPHLIAAISGYKQFVRFEGPTLVVGNAYYFDFEGNCCPTAAMLTSYRLAGDRLTAGDKTWLLLGERERPATFAEVTVAAFYRALDARRYEDAYAFLSPAFQAANPFAAWRAGYATTERIEAEVSAGATPNEVEIILTVVDSIPNAMPLTRHFAGAWTLIPSADGESLLLDRADIRQR